MCDKIRGSKDIEKAQEIVDGIYNDFKLRKVETFNFIEYLKNDLNEMPDKFERECGDGDFSDINDEVERIKKSTFLNCWHMAENQNMAMWKVYGQFEECIAIKTTIRKLDTLLSKNKEALIQDGLTYAIKQVKYISKDPKTHPDYFYLEGDGKSIVSLVFKHEIYAYEKEIRLILTIWDPKTNKFIHNKGYLLKIGDKSSDITAFIDEIYINPILTEGHWFVYQIRHINKLHGLEHLKIVHEPLKTDIEGGFL